MRTFSRKALLRKALSVGLALILMVWCVPCTSFASASTAIATEDAAAVQAEGEASQQGEDQIATNTVKAVGSIVTAQAQALDSEDLEAKAASNDAVGEGTGSADNAEDENTENQPESTDNSADGGQITTADTSSETLTTQDSAGSLDISQSLKSIEIQVRATPCNEFHELKNDGTLVGAHSGDTVAKGADVTFSLTFKPITTDTKTLVYNLPDNLIDSSAANSDTGKLAGGDVNDAQSSGTQKAGNWTLRAVKQADGTETATIEVDIDDDYYDSNKHKDDNSIDLHEFNFEFSGSLSSNRGEHSANNDAKVTFSGSSNAGVNDITYTIPFEYLNEHSQVNLTKTSDYDAETRIITYTITATTPGSNTKTAKDVKITDSFTNGNDYLSNKYANAAFSYIDATGATISKGSFSNGVWTIGDMEPGNTATLTYTAKINGDKYFTDTGVITNMAEAAFNTDGKTQASNTLDSGGTLIITKKSTGTSTTTEGKTSLTYELTVSAHGSNVDNVVVKDAFDHPDVIDSYTQKSASKGTFSEVSDGNNKTMKWEIGTVEVGKPVTLTYEVAVNEAAWDQHSSVQGDTTNGVQLSLTNTAGVYASDSTKEIKYDEKSVTTTVKRAIITKTGIPNVADGSISYTVDINTPNNGMCGNVFYIQDALTAGSYAGENVTLYVYSPNGTLVASLQVPLSKIYTASSNNKAWQINLDKVPVTSVPSGVTANTDGTVNVASTSTTPYYYSLTYKATNTGYISNTAGVGYGTAGKKQTRTMTYGGTTTNFSYVKEATSFDINKGLAGWKITIKSTIPKDSGIEDVLQPTGDCGAKDGCSYFTEDQINALVVKQGSETFAAGTDYEIVGSKHSDDKDGMYYGFKIKFLHEIAADGNNPVTIEYSSSVGEDDLYDNHAGKGTWKNNNYSTFCYNIGTPDETREKQQEAFDEFTPTNENISKNYICYDESTGEMVWYMLVNKGSLISGRATVTEYIPEGQTFSSADVIYADRAGGYFVRDLWVVDNDNPEQKTKLGEDSAEYQYFKNNNLFNDASDRGNQLAYTGDKAGGVYVENIEYGTWTDNNGKTGQKVTITLNGLQGYESFLQDRSVSVNGKSEGGGANWDGRGKFTLRVKTRLSGDDLMAISAGSGTVSKEYTNKAVFSQGETYIRGAEDSATGTVSKVEDLLTKADILREGPAYAEYSLDVNPTSQNLMADKNDPVTVYDVMSSNMTLATDHVVSDADTTPQYFDVYDVSKVDSSDIYTNGKITKENMSAIRSKAENITNQCTIEDITGEDADSQPTYKITVPDEKHVVVLYWATLNGTLSLDSENPVENQAKFYYKGELQDNTSGTVGTSIKVMEANSSLFSGPYFKVRKSSQSGNLLPGATFAMYKYVENGEDEFYSRATTDKNGYAYFGHRNEDTEGVPINKDTIYYLVEETAPDGYVLDATPYYFEFKTADAAALTVDGAEVHQLITGGTADISNVESVDISVTKNWNDGNNQDGIRPDSVTVNLMKQVASDQEAEGDASAGQADGDGADNANQGDSGQGSTTELVKTKEITPDENGNWTTYTFENLPKYDADGNEIIYTIKEDPVEGYTAEVTGSVQEGFVITNSNEAATTSVNVSKVWNDSENKDNIRPDSVTVQLLADGVALEGKTLTLNSENEWKGTFEGLPVNANGQAITYTIEELEIDGYTSEISGDASNGFVITNSHTPDPENTNPANPDPENDPTNPDPGSETTPPATETETPAVSEEPSAEPADEQAAADEETPAVDEETTAADEEEGNSILANTGESGTILLVDALLNLSGAIALGVLLYRRTRKQ